MTAVCGQVASKAIYSNTSTSTVINYILHQKRSADDNIFSVVL